ncbi:MAG TPA: glycogen debranching N-terminal domain-containing protein, partial [Kofleriaceae bacterium]|nr:glycogen debranching N-terminal domain-containing protein [Kofleriaceae bacterium]
MIASDDVIRVRDRYYILATSTLADERTRVLKHDDTFAIFDRQGDIRSLGSWQQGLFQGDTRMLSRLELHVGAARPLLLSSTVTEDNSVLAVDLTNPDLDLDGRPLARDTVHILRSVCLWQRCCSMRLRLLSFGSETVHLPVQLSFDADFADMFEVRGTARGRRGELLPAETEAGQVRLSYRGLDQRLRAVTLGFDPPPTRLSAGSASWDVALEPGQNQLLRVAVTCEAEGRVPAPLLFEAARAAQVGALRASSDSACRIVTSSEQFNEWLNRSAADLHMMMTSTPAGPYPYAGVPWFSAPFGRDGIITAFETLWVEPAIAAGVLRFLAATQATETIPEQDAEPGKIVHEMRTGEMAALGEVPFGRYYGSVDATPLFVLLAASYHEATADTALIEAIWPAVERALGWLARHGDVDGDGYVEYARRTQAGLAHQGWKDSQDPISHEDGSLARGAIALCEVQAYAHGAWLGAARLAEALGMGGAGHRARGDALREQFERDFWCEELGTYAIALDGDKRQCRVRSSNAGHVLFTGTASPERAERVARALMAEDSFSGWGVRTLSGRERRYNPMSYHNGSVWPHDNAIVAAGMARYG